METVTSWDVSVWSTAGVHEKEEKEERERAKEEARATWEKEAGPAQDELYSRAGIDKEAANIRASDGGDPEWACKEEASLCEAQGVVDEGDRRTTERTGTGSPGETAAYGEAKRNLRRAIRRAKKSCWEEYVQEVGKEQLWRAVRYTAPRLEGKVQMLVDETGNKATSRKEREHMLIATAFPEAPDAGEQPPLPDGGLAHRQVNKNLVGRLLATTRNASAPGRDRMGAEIVKIMWELVPEHITALVRACIELGHHPEGWKTA